MITRGNVVAVLRKAEFMHMEQLLEPHRNLNNPSRSDAHEQTTRQGDQTDDSHHPGMQAVVEDGGLVNDESLDFRMWNSLSNSVFEHSMPAADEILTLAEQLEDGDFSATFLFE